MDATPAGGGLRPRLVEAVGDRKAANRICSAAFGARGHVPHAGAAHATPLLPAGSLWACVLRGSGVAGSNGDRWWQGGVIYQIYPRSFQDSNGDGVGDLAGIKARLDHLVELGVDAIWIAPIYPSPMADFGYDVSDHCDVDPIFGSLADFDRLIEAAHERGLRVILDFVPNHTSDQHPWFRESRRAPESPKRDWYIWRDPKPDGSPPSNWLSEFGGPAWTLGRATGQYYYHAYTNPR
jgi:hypothetical protein